MQALRIERRWVRWWIGCIAGGLVGLFGWVIYRTLQMPNSEDQMIRVFIPFYAVGAYLGLAFMVNRRVVLVTPDKVAFRNGPIPLGLSQTVQRGDIALCYLRYVFIRSRKYGDEKYYSAGIETVRGHQIDTSGRLQAKEEAWKAASEVAQALNADPRYTAVSVEYRNVAPITPVHKRLVLIWWAILTLAIFVGGYWEVKSH